MKNFECSNSVDRRSDSRGILFLKILFALFFLALASINNVFSQDIIVKKDKSEIKAKVIEIQDASIKYKPFEFLDGPLRSIQISDVSSIKYEKGNIETFTPVPISTNPVTASVNSEPASINQPSSETPVQAYYPLRVLGRVSYQIWHAQEISEAYANNVLLGAGLERQLSDDFKIGADLDYGSLKNEDYTLAYTQYGAYIKYSRHPFGSRRPNICGGIGIKGISLKESGDGDIGKGSSVGFSALLGVEIPLGKKVILDLGWNSVWSNMDYEGTKINVGSEIFSAGLIFNLW